MRRSMAALATVSVFPLLLGWADASAQSAGVTAAVNPTVRGTPPGQSIRSIVLGDRIIRNERIDTSPRGLTQILLGDGTTFTVGPNSSIVIDDFVYNPDSGNAQISATLARGVFRFIGGRTSKTRDGVTLDTPVGTVGIRGAVVNISLEPRIVGIIAHIDMIFGNEVTLTVDGRVVRRVYQPGYSIVIGADGEAYVQKTPRDWTTSVQMALAGTPGTSGGTRNPPDDRKVAESGVRAAAETDDAEPAALTQSAQEIALRQAPISLLAPLPGDEPLGTPTLSAELYALGSPLFGATANYVGRVGGTVVPPVGVAFQTVGDLQMSWDFGTRTGLMNIDNFAGRSFNSTLVEDPGIFADFTGDLFEGGFLGGTASGGFVDVNGLLAGGVSGRIDFTDALGWSTTGGFQGLR